MCVFLEVALQVFQFAILVNLLKDGLRVVFDVGVGVHYVFIIFNNVLSTEPLGVSSCLRVHMPLEISQQSCLLL